MQLLSPETPLLEFNRRQTSPTSTSTSRTLLVLASQHGDEPCGVLAVNQLLTEAEQEERRAAREGGDNSSSSSSSSPSSPSWPFREKDGCAFDRVVIALANPRAFAKNTRQIDDNLNRCFPLERDLAAISKDQSSYERQRAGELALLLAGADAVLDLHSASAASPPFAMFPPSSSSSASLARALLGIPYALRDFTGQGLGLAIEWAAKNGKGGKGTTAAVTLEAGQHSSVSSVGASVSAIRSALRWRGEGEQKEKDRGEEAAAENLLRRPKCLVVRRGETVRKGFVWETENKRPTEAFARFAFGELVARDDVKGEMRCDIEGGARIVLPAARPVEGEDAFLWGEEEEEEEEGEGEG